MAGVYQQFISLTLAEKRYMWSHPHHANTIRNSKNIAFQETQSRFKHNGHNDKSDAFRHCFWSATLARDLGVENARTFTTAHESDPNNPSNEKMMDLHNNSVGLKVGSRNGTNTAYSNACMANLVNNQLISIK